MIKYRHTYKIVNPTEFIKSSNLTYKESLSPYIVDNRVKALLERYVLEHFNGKDEMIYYVCKTDREVKYLSNNRDGATDIVEEVLRGFECHIYKDGTVKCYEILDFDKPLFHSFKISITNEKINNKKK